jgi:hypothetical protein
MERERCAFRLEVVWLYSANYKIQRLGYV